jgi:methyl-accepting chemotaxis protein
MFENWTFGRRLAVGFGLAGLILAVVGIVAYRNTEALVENNARLTHSYLVRVELASLQNDLADAETGQRGFIITGDENYLEPYKASLQVIKATFADLMRLTSDNQDQQRRLKAISPLIDTKLAELAQAIGVRRSQGMEAAAKLVDSDVGKATMDQIRRLVAEAKQQESDLLDARSAAANDSAQTAKTIIFWGGLAGVALVAAAGWFITRSLSAQIGSAVGQVRSSSAELQSASNQQTTSAKEQATAMSEITTTINELLATSRQIADSARRVAQVAEQTVAASRTGQESVESTRESISGIRRQVDQIVAHMLELGNKSQEIGQVLDIVQELAEQTNILAINATIEAAGAGEAGKRFGIVADEIRKLADRVGNSAKDIRTLIEDVRAAVNKTVMTTETGSKAVDVGSRQFGEVVDRFREITGLVSTTTDASREIELSTKQQATAVEQVNVAVANVAQASRETEASSAQTLQTASQLATLSAAILRIVKPQAAA